MTDHAERLAELLPCPFCGGTAEFENYVMEAGIWCKPCGLLMKRRHAPDSDSHAISAVTSAWNRRYDAQRAAVAEPYEDDLGRILREREELQAEVARLRKDAERYAYSKTMEGQELTIRTFREQGGSHLDAAIDAAMGEKT
jgi:hypothetical protein